jgi:hypothetical protein
MSQMAALSHSICRKLSLLQLAEGLGNVSKACQIMGYHRDSFYEIRRAFQRGGVSLVEQKRGPRCPYPPGSRRGSSSESWSTSWRSRRMVPSASRTSFAFKA